MSAQYDDQTMYPDNLELNELWREWRRAQEEWMAAQRVASEFSNRLGLRPGQEPAAIDSEELLSLPDPSALLQRYQDVDARYVAMRDRYLQQRGSDRRE